MNMMKKLTCMVDDELQGAKQYVKCALMIREDHPSLAKVFYNLSEDEMGHVATLQNEISKLIDKHRDSGAEELEAVKTVYEYIHEGHIDKINKIKMYQEQYKEY